MRRFRKRAEQSDNSSYRIKLIFGGFTLIFLIVGIRLFTIQVLGHDKYKSMALDQYWYSYEIPARRGDIISSDGFLLAGTQIDYLMYLEPNNVQEKYETAHKLAEIVSQIKYDRYLEQKKAEALENKLKEKIVLENEGTGNEENSGETAPDDSVGEPEDPEKPLEEVTKDDFFKELYDKYYEALQKDLMWVAVERELNPLEKQKIEENEIFGMGFEEEPVRYYPEGTLSSHVLGFVASNEIGDKVGYFGIEGSFNEDLKGKPGRILEEKDALGTPILMGGYKKVEPIQGRDLVLSVNKSIQYMVEKKLKEGVEKYDAASGTVIVMNPSTGAVIAMANYPTYDPAKFYEEGRSLKGSPHRMTINRTNNAISQTYEPGSVFKPFTVSAAVDLGRVTPETTYQDNGPVNYSTHVIDNWDGKHYGTMNIIQLLQKSNNIGAAWVGHQVGAKDLYSYLENFGIGAKTGIDLEGEDSGILNDYQEWLDITLANISFGQGVSATPLQILNGFNAIANGGYLVQPKIVEKIVDENEIIEIPTKQVKKVMNKETSDTMVMMLEKAAEGGEAQFFVLKNYKIAGKTGTAQIPVPGGYAEDRTNATFTGFDSTNKNFSMIVKLEDPKAKIFASESAVPIWMDIFKELVKFYGIAPDKIADASN